MVAGVDRGFLPAIFCGMKFFRAELLPEKGKEVVCELAESAEVGCR